MTKQGELDFSVPDSPSGLDRWREERLHAQRTLARRLGLPLGHQVEVWLHNGIRLRGELRLSEEFLIIPEDAPTDLTLVVGGTSFAAAEVQSCIRQD
jgi:hypothetical protein